MSSNNYTPGPDAVEAFNLAICEYSDGIGRTYDTPECDDAYSAGRSVAELPAPWHSLCAAAPDLLAALRGFVELLECTLAHPKRGPFRPTVRGLVECMAVCAESARAAIARAEGRGA